MELQVMMRTSASLSTSKIDWHQSPTDLTTKPLGIYKFWDGDDRRDLGVHRQNGIWLGAASESSSTHFRAAHKLE